MDTFFLFTDGSVDTKSKIGFGAFLFISELAISPTLAEQNIHLKRFEETSSSKLELQTLICALNAISVDNIKLIVFTDSQNIIGLPGRREKLERNEYLSKNGKLLDNHDLYRSFFNLIDQRDVTFEKVKGHQRSHQKNKIDDLFTLVDRASRKALRNEFLAN